MKHEMVQLICECYLEGQSDAAPSCFSAALESDRYLFFAFHPLCSLYFPALVQRLLTSKAEVFSSRVRGRLGVNTLATPSFFWETARSFVMIPDKNMLEFESRFPMLSTIAISSLLVQYQLVKPSKQKYVESAFHTRDWPFEGVVLALIGCFCPARPHPEMNFDPDYIERTYERAVGAKAELLRWTSNGGRWSSN